MIRSSVPPAIHVQKNSSFQKANGIIILSNRPIPTRILLCDPFREPSSGPPLYSQSQAHPFICESYPREVTRNLKGTPSGSISVGQGSKGVWAGRK